jgi:nucleoside diphosphate kinase
MKKQGILFGALGVCLVVVLVVGFAGAAAATPQGFGKSARNETAPGQGHGASGNIIDKLEQQGVDVSAAKTAIANNDTAALKTWLDSYRESHPRNQTASENKPPLSNIISKLESQGVDVSAAKTAIANNDMAALKTWLDSYRESHPRNQTASENRPLMGNLISKLASQGVDVSAAETAIANNDTTALKTWLDQFRALHKGEMRGNTTGGRPS